ncbi:unnamed protein product [Macrosiphum euphorbiae]|uniref:CUB domain-containing protein n=1 Tax=Macrosiphum euphorbiae TaxID=13131 RepID=A0AAV0XZH3_9HEMI|nr:unnamed protein product [Macrosiphum euphorbiae]
MCEDRKPRQSARGHPVWRRNGGRHEHAEHVVAQRRVHVHGRGDRHVGHGQQTVDPRGRNAGRKQHCSHCTVYKPLAELRETRTVQRGSFDGKDLSQCVYAFTRSLPSAETYLVVINVGSEDEHVDLSNWPTLEKDETWQVHTPSDNAQYSIGYSFETNGFTLRPKSAIVLCDKKELSSSSSSSSLPSKSISPSSLVCILEMLVPALFFTFAHYILPDE